MAWPLKADGALTFKDRLSRGGAVGHRSRRGAPSEHNSVGRPVDKNDVVEQDELDDPHDAVGEQ